MDASSKWMYEDEVEKDHRTTFQRFMRTNMLLGTFQMSCPWSVSSALVQYLSTLFLWLNYRKTVTRRRRRVSDGVYLDIQLLVSLRGDVTIGTEVPYSCRGLLRRKLQGSGLDATAAGATKYRRPSHTFI